MKKIFSFSAIILFVFCNLLGLSVYAQNNSLILNGAVTVLNGGTVATPIYVVVNQNNTAGIVRNSGHIHSENQYNYVKWVSGTNTGNYVFPFGVAGNFSDYIPLTFNKTTAGSSNVQLSTWFTNVPNFPRPAATNVGPVTNMFNYADSVQYAIDRFWDIRTSAATTANLTFSYRGIENTTVNPTGLVRAQHWNGTSWDAPVTIGNSGVTAGIGTTGPFMGQTTFSPWVLSVVPICPQDTVSYAGNPYCNNINTPQPISHTNGALVGTYTALPAGLSIDFNTGAINPSLSTAGTYTVTFVVNATPTCPDMVATTIVTINAVDNPVFTYSSATFCLTGTNPSPTSISTSGGTFTITAPGVINATTGEINLSASGLGPFTVTYNTTSAGNPCPDSSTLVITITSAPSAEFSYDAAQYCQDAAAPVLTFGAGASGGVFSSNSPGLDLNTSNGTITLPTSAAGIYTIYNTILPSGGCAAALDSTTITIDSTATINLTSALGTDGQTVCVNTAITDITYAVGGGGTGAGVTGLPAGVTGSFSSGVFTLSGTPTVTGIFNYTVTTTGTCAQVTANGTITVNPDATINLTSAVGTDAQIFCQGAGITNITYAVGGGGTGAGVTGLPAGVTGSFSGGVFTISGTPTVTGIYNYTVTTTGTCAQTTANGTITINPDATINLTSAIGTDAQIFCQGAGTTNITYAVGGGGTGAGVIGLPAGVTGSFSAGVFTISGTPTVIGTFNYTVTTIGTCTQITANGTITINPDATLNLTSAIGTDAQTFCQGAAITNITYAVGGGGTGAGVTGLPAGVTGSFSGGVFTISGTPTVSGTFNYTVTTTGTCAQAIANGVITIDPQDDASFSYTGNTHCLTGTNPIATITGTTGGTFFITAPGVIDLNTGEINLSASGLGSFTVTYNTTSAGNPCPNSATTVINITNAPSAAFSYDAAQYCQDEAAPILTFGAGSSAGVFSYSPNILPDTLTLNPSNGDITLTSSAAGIYIVYNSIAASGGCAAALDSTTIEILQIDDASFNYATGNTYCLTGTNPIATITGTVGGTFTISPPGVFVDANTGEINLSASGLGTFTVYYYTPIGNACPQLDSTIINITAAPTAGFSYDVAQVCQDGVTPILTMDVGATAGIFSSSPAGLTLDSITGAITLPSSSGIYTVYNTVAAAGGCSAALDSTTIEILQIDDASFIYLTGATYCLTGTNPIASVTGTTGGTFTISLPGVLVDTLTGEIDLLASGLGTFTVYYNTPVGNVCPQVDSTTINIVNAPGASFTYNTPFCAGDANALPTFVGNNFPGVFSSNPVGVVIFVDTLIGEIDLTTTPSGTYTIYNNLAASGGCAAALDSFEITINPSFNIQETVSVCSGGSYTFPDGTSQTNITSQVIYISSFTTSLGCDSLVETTVDVNPVYFVQIIDSVCAGNSYTFPDGSIQTINTQVVDTSLLQTTLGCDSLVEVTVNLKAPVLSQESNSICSGGSYTFPDGTLINNLTSDTVYISTLTASTGCDSIVTTSLTINSTILSQETVSVCSGGSYTFPDGSTQNNITVQVIYNSNLTTTLGCDSIIETTVSINPTYNTQETVSICSGGSYTFPDGSTQTNITLPTTYTSNLTTTVGCDSIIETTVNVNPIPTVTVTSGGIVCAGSTINFTPSSGGTWFSSNTSVATIDNTGLVTGISVGNANMVFTDATTGCLSNSADGLVIVGGVTAVIGATPSSGFMPLDVVFTNTSTVGVSYTWNFGDASATSILYEPSHTYNGLGNYIATLIVSDGLCSDTALITIEVIGQSSILIPNVFTPNGDGSNDVFTIDGTNLESVEAEIFNRWGQKMYSWNHVKGYWDGRTQSGIEAPDGTYFYIISAKGMDGEEYFKKGGFSLIR